DHAARVNEVASGARSRLESSLLDVNRLTSELGQLNRQIVNGEVSGRVASDLRDQRDRVLDSLAELAGIQVGERGNGSAGVVLSGQPVRFAVAGSSEPLHNVGGSLGAVARVLNEDIPSVTRQLDLVASSLVQAVNELHMTGWSPAGDPAGADPAWAGSQVVFF